jgi:phosphomannomutase
MSQDSVMDPALAGAAHGWLAEDPDPATRAELDLLLKEASTGDAAALADLADRFDGRLQFGTAGLRGEMGAGPNRMNRVTVIRAAAGLAAFLTEQHGPGATVAVGYDARHNSRQFAEDTAAVMAGAGHKPRLLPRALPTPALAFSVRHLAAQAGVMVTASHNPARDNGYKVYLDDGSQIAPPNDALIAARIDAVGPLESVPRGAIGALVAEDVIDAYVARSRELLTPAVGRDVRIVHTAMHGVGWELFRRVLMNAGFPEPLAVLEQATPDPDFPTVAFPNPEEAGALDRAIDLASAQREPVDAILANDPDADRLAVAVREPSGRWRQLSGDDVGLLLGWHLASGKHEQSASGKHEQSASGKHERSAAGKHEQSVEAPPRGSFASTIVSSEGLAAVCEHAGTPYARTLTGFKWLSKVPRLRYAYEEAIGYCCDPSHVNDKDGVTAGLIVAELIARLKADGRTLLDGLAEVDRITGNRVTAQLSIRSDDSARIQGLMRRLRTSGPSVLGDIAVRSAEDLSVAGKPLPADQGLRLVLEGGWIAVRPSGTEPKLKCYIEIGDPTAETRAPVVERLAAVKAELAAWFDRAG